MAYRTKKSRGIRLALFALSVALFLAAISSPLMVAVSLFDGDRPTVVIDAGHGGEDGGVTGTRTGARESDVNLSVALLLGEYLKSGGFRVVYTRKNDVMLTHPNVVGNKKRADMYARGDVINNARPVMVISVHANFYSSAARRGAQVFYSAKKQEDKNFATVIQETLNRDVNSAVGKSYSALSAEKYLLDCSPYPTVIAECGFLSNPLDEALLTTPAYQAKLAYTLFQGMAAYYGSLTSYR